MKLVNLTPHPVKLIAENGTLELVSHGTVRLATKQGLITNLLGIPVVKEELSDPVIELKENIQGAGVIVSALTASSKKAVQKLLNNGAVAVFTLTDFVRDDQGRIVGARKLNLVDGVVPCPYCGLPVTRDSVDLETLSFTCPNCNTQQPAEVSDDS